MSNVLSTNQSKFLKVMITLHNDAHCSFKCEYPNIANIVFFDNHYNTVQRAALNLMRNDYIRYKTNETNRTTNKVAN